MKASKEAFANSLTGTVDKYVKQAARDTIVENCERDPAKVRYARIADSKSCDFCTMLSSRGFVYHSERTAALAGPRSRFSQYHPYCNCQIAVAFDVEQEWYWKNKTHVSRGFSENAKLAARGADGSRKLRAYDPDDLFALYQGMGGKFGRPSKIFPGKQKLADQEDSPFGSVGDMERYLSEAVSMDDLKDRCDLVGKWWNKNAYSDRYWTLLQIKAREMKKTLTGGTARRPITIEEGALPLKKEYRVAEWLADRGMEVRFRATRSAEGKRTSDVFIDGIEWEIKQPTGNGRQTVYHQFEEAAGQSTRIIIDTSVIEAPGSGDKWNRDSIEKEVRKLVNWSYKDSSGNRVKFSEAILISGDGYMKRIKGS